MAPPDEETWYGIVFVHGHHSEFWKVSSLQSIKLLSLETSTQKRQRKGGSSSARISRLRENKRDRNVSFVSEELENTYYDWDANKAIVSGLIIAGSSETTLMVLNELPDGLKRILVQENTIPWQDCNANALYEHCQPAIENFHITQERKLLEPFHTILATKPDLLDFGVEYIMERIDMYKVVYTSLDIKGPNIVNIRYVDDLAQYGIVAVKY